MDDAVIERVVRRVVEEMRAVTPTTGTKVALAGLVLALMVNAGGLIWGAAMLSSTVRQNGMQITQTATLLQQTVRELNDLNTQVQLNALEIQNLRNGRNP